MDKKASNKIDTQKRNDHLLSLRPEKSWPIINSPKNKPCIISLYTYIYIYIQGLHIYR
jgi:hypothetical protein